MTNFSSLSTPAAANRDADIFPPIGIIFRLNAGLINALQSATASWVQRRQEAARDAIESFERLARCRDIGEAMTIQREWVERSMRRLDEDLSPLASQMPDMLHAAVSAGTNAAAAISDAAQPAAGEAEAHPRAADHDRRPKEKEASSHRPKPAGSGRKRRR